jgi:putative polyhydroxyalkanoate system protein
MRGRRSPRSRAPILPVLRGRVHPRPIGLAFAEGEDAAARKRLRRRFGYTRRSSTGTAMSTISIAKKHHLSHKKAKEAAQKVAEDLHKRFSLAYEWHGDCVTFTRPGLSGELVVHHDEVRLDCKLGFLLTAIKPAIEQEVHKEFDKRFGVRKA